MMNTWRLIVEGARAGAANMARDEALFLSAPEAGLPTLRLYAFDPPAVTIGRFQRPETFLDQGECESAGVQVVRRPTGGLAILHQSDLTYSFTAPLEGTRDAARDRYFSMVAQGLLAGLRVLGIAAQAAAHGVVDRGPGWCFAGEFGVDLSWRSRKICGSAQRIGAEAVLQHGSVFLADNSALLERISATGDSRKPVSRFVALNEAAGRELTFEEVARAVTEGFRSSLGVGLEAVEVPETVTGAADELLRRKYSAGAWSAPPPL